MDSSVLAGNEVHIFDLSKGDSNATYDYKCIPARTEGGAAPSKRFAHAATVVKGSIYVFGGCSETDILPERDCFWRFDSETLRWSNLAHQEGSISPEPRYFHSAVSNDKTIVICGGVSVSSSISSNDVWAFDINEQKWKNLLSFGAYENSPPPSMTLTDDTLYVIDHTLKLETVIHTLALHTAEATWQSITIPAQVANPLPRQGAGLIPVSTGMGRQYLLYMLGEKVEMGHPQSESKLEENEFWSGLWSYQIDSMKGSLARAKDVTKEKLGMDSERATWAEVEIKPSSEEGKQGKSHPGPRGQFAIDRLDQKTVVLWGGVNPKGDVEGDGWIIALE